MEKKFVKDNVDFVGNVIPSWDSASFISRHSDLMRLYHLGDKNAYISVKKLRSFEYHNTISLVNQGYYITEAGDYVKFPDMTPMQKGSTFYREEFRVDHIPALDVETTIIVRNVDCLDEGVRLVRDGYNPAILNMASRRIPGGGVMTGAGAQEESLFRRTNLFRSLYKFTDEYAGKRWYDNYITPAPKRFRYPLDRNFGGVYTPGALLFRENERCGYKLMNSPERLSFIAVAGISHPQLSDSNHLAYNMIEGTKNKMRTILRIGLQKGHDSLVLGALGCGAFRNPPVHIAQLFHEVFEEKEFKNKFRLISFAILDDHNSHRSHNIEGNFIPFAREFKQLKLTN